MQVNNVLAEESFCYTSEKPNLSVREDEIYDMEAIIRYCGLREVNEKVAYRSDSIWYKQVEQNVTLVDWLYSGQGEGSEDSRRMLADMFEKSIIYMENTTLQVEQILISLGEFEDAAEDLVTYIEKRRSKLKQCKTAEEYEGFMRSCFVKSIYAENILEEMKRIEDFSEYTAEITESLGVLNDEAVDLYEKYHDNLNLAMDFLSAKLRACAPDPKHKGKLDFTFVYEECLDGVTESKTKVINCSPHLKLIRKDSNLRIYFWWRDREIGNNEKVLVGRIGRHPY